MLSVQIQKVRDEIHNSAIKYDKNPAEIQIIAVTKTHSVSVIKEAIRHGLDFIAESKVQESEMKIPALLGLYKEFHFIGHLQSNKINKILALKPSLIQSIDKFSTAEKLNLTLKKMNLTQNILIEVNTSGEINKNGVCPTKCSELIKQISELEYIKIKCLMTIGSFSEDENKISRCFKSLKELFETEKALSRANVDMKYLSMGMSNDFQIAIKEGSNMLRLGSIFFGERIKR